MVRTIFRRVALLSLFALLAACTRATLPQNAPTETAPVGELKIFTWSEYFDDEFLKKFGEAHHVKVKADYFSSNEEMLAKLQITGGDAGYDIILPSDYMMRDRKSVV